jgi:hypothetical protein
MHHLNAAVCSAISEKKTCTQRTGKVQSVASLGGSPARGGVHHHKVGLLLDDDFMLIHNTLIALSGGIVCKGVQE